MNSLLLALDPTLIGCCGRTSTSADTSYRSLIRKEKEYPATVATMPSRTTINARRRSMSKIGTGSIHFELRLSAADDRSCFVSSTDTPITRPAPTRQQPILGCLAFVLIGIEHALVVDAQRRVLIFLAGDAIAGDEELDIGTHKAAERVFRGADDRLTPDVEAGVDQHRAAGARLECREQ